ncbi:MAG TPA: glycosyltransferase family 2 protein [Candidatus Acidoferrum sp.]|nr:glycosyltransferase family 2 protein [Candidatus Acidoferrum sp.]
MQHELPLVTIIVPTKPGQAEIKAVDAARRLDYPADKIEIFVARGKQPAVQRNHAIREARGEIIYFLDDDSQPAPDTLRRAIEHFRDPAVQMVGGPNLCPPDAPFIERVFAVALASWIAFGPSRARYDRVGKTRASSEKELILCNLLARRAPLLELGGFDESLYPNEENALMDDLQKRGGKLIYDPDVLVHRRPRPTLNAFIKMLMTYGRGRAEQFRLHPTPGSALNFVPPLFVVYFVAIHLLILVRPGPLTQIAFVPMAFYWLALLIEVLKGIPHHGFVKSLCSYPLLFLTHVFYGVGFWRGLFTSINKSKPAMTEVLIERHTI